MQDRVTAETFSEEKTIATEKIAVKEENIQAQQRAPSPFCQRMKDIY